MIVVAILGVLAAVAIPAFGTYLRRSKTSDAYGTIAHMFTLASSYFDRPVTTDPSMMATYTTHCTVASSSTFSGVPGTQKRGQEMTEPYSDRGFAFGISPSYYRFGHTLDGVAGCGLQGAADGNVYVLTANGDLDGDGTQSTFSLTVGSSEQTSLYKARSIFVNNELE
jgi:hypothetical protein